MELFPPEAGPCRTRTSHGAGSKRDECVQAMTSIFENMFKKDKKFPLDLSTVSPEDLREAYAPTSGPNWRCSVSALWLPGYEPYGSHRAHNLLPPQGT